MSSILSGKTDPVAKLQKCYLFSYLACRFEFAPSGSVRSVRLPAGAEQEAWEQVAARKPLFAELPPLRLANAKPDGVRRTAFGRPCRIQCSTRGTRASGRRSNSWSGSSPCSASTTSGRWTQRRWIQRRWTLAAPTFETPVSWPGRNCERGR